MLTGIGPGFSCLLLTSDAPPGAKDPYEMEGLFICRTLVIASHLFPDGGTVPRFTRYLFILPNLLLTQNDAVRTLAAFAQSARDEVELEALTGELVRVVEETLQPERAFL